MPLGYHFLHENGVEDVLLIMLMRLADVSKNQMLYSTIIHICTCTSTLLCNEHKNRQKQRNDHGVVKLQMISQTQRFQRDKYDDVRNNETRESKCGCGADGWMDGCVCRRERIR